jgi:hypothetical protein
MSADPFDDWPDWVLGSVLLFLTCAALAAVSSAWVLALVLAGLAAAVVFGARAG